MTAKSTLGGHRWNAVLGAAVVLALCGGLAVVLYSLLGPLDDDAVQRESMNIDADLRTAAHLAAIPGLTDGSLEWLPKQHTIRSSHGSATLDSLTFVRFDVASSTFCIAASNGHRITDASADVEDGTCEAMPPAAGGMTSQELALARDVARLVISETQATVTSATVTADNEGVFGSSTALACTSRRILHIVLTGAFPRIVVSPAMGDSNATARALQIAVDGKTGRTCAETVVTRGDVQPANGSVVLQLG